ncbi:hypothetical protein BR93DRAFT_867044, partial [Coniochaeta sp. PMI_546]
SPLRVFVRCLSHKIPGRRSDRTVTMANIICQYYVQRDMDPGKESISSRGFTDIDGRKVKFLLDYAINIFSPFSVILVFDETSRVPRDVDTRTRAYIHNIPFKYKPPVQKPRNPKTMAQMRASMDDEAWDRYMGEVILRKLQYKKKASAFDRSWAKERPELFYDVIQQFTAQQRWHKLELPPSLKQWVEAQTDRGNPSTFVHLIDVVLDNLGIETGGEPPAL